MLVTPSMAGTTLRIWIVKRRQLAGSPPFGGCCSRIARGTRTLQRRLLEEGMSFHSVVEEARREMAKHYLLQSSLELNETAYFLGYEDPNSFIRAFHKWEGASPGEWRSKRAKNAAVTLKQS